MTPRRKALIVGAGVGGLAAGIALRRAGWEARIFERAREVRALGFALNLAPNAVQALRELGVAERVMAGACAVGRAELRRADGSVVRRFSIAADLGQLASLFVLRPALHGALLAATPSDSLVLDSEAVRFDAASGRAVLELQDGRSETGDVLIGADGVASVIRRLLHPDEPPPRRSGYYGIRGVAHNAASHLGNVTAVGYFAHGIEAATVQASESAVYWYISLLADDVGTFAADGRVILQRCSTLLDGGFHAIVEATDPEDVRLDELFDREPMDAWGSGPVTLLGDAAHPMLPHTGQGAAQALEDAVALGLALSPVDVENGLRRYERVRARRTRAIVRRGPRIAAVTTTKSPLIKWMREAAIRLVPARAITAGFLLAGGHDPHAPLRPNPNSSSS